MATATKPKKKAPTVKLTLATFDARYDGKPWYRVLRKGVALKDFSAVTNEEYLPNGGTPLIDATVEFIETMLAQAKKSEVNVGLMLDESGSMAPNTAAVITSVNEFVQSLRKVSAPDPETGGKGFLVIATDGHENQSTKHGYEDVRQMLNKCEKKGWIVMFLGAGIDAWAQGQKLGLSGTASGQTVSTVSSPMGTAAAFASASSDGVGYLGDHASYVKCRSGSAVRSLSEDGKETVFDPSQQWSGAPPTSPASTFPPGGKGAYDPAEAIKRATDKLSE